MSWSFKEVIPKIGTITEGACWNGSLLLFSNISQNRILSLNPETNELKEIFKDTGGANGLNFNKDGSLFACEGNRRQLSIYHESGKKECIVDSHNNKKINSPNDLAITPFGSIYFSDRVGDINPEVGLMYSAIISAEPMEDGSYKTYRRTFDTSMPNGLLFSKNYDELYVAQSDYRADQKRELRSYKVNKDGSLNEMQVLHDFGPHRGIDGMTLSDDGLIIACTGWEISGPGGNITIFDNKGRIIETHPTPCERPTNCTLVGNKLYVTSIEGHLLVAETDLNGYLLWP